MNKKLFVGNLSYNMTKESLSEIFSEVGTVAFARVVSDRMTGRSKGFGFIEMSTPDEAQEAVRTLNGREVSGRALKVTEAREPDDAPRRPYSDRGGDHRGGGGGGDRDSRPRSYGHRD